MRIVTIFVRHGIDKYSEAEQQLQDIFARQMPHVERRTIIVDNALQAGFAEELDKNRTLIGGDNSFREFSAWDQGIAYLANSIWSYDLVNLATNTFQTLYVKYLNRFDSQMLSAIIGRPVCVGHIDCYNEPIRLLSFYSQHWVRTSFFFLPPTELKILGSLVSFRGGDTLFGPGPEKPFCEDAPLSTNYKDYILKWLTGGDIGQGNTWHSSFALDSKSWPLFRAKALAICNEHLFSMRLRAQGTRIIDTTWLAGELSGVTQDSIDWTKGWRSQIAERDTDRLVLAASTD